MASKKANLDPTPVVASDDLDITVPAMKLVDDFAFAGCVSGQWDDSDLILRFFYGGKFRRVTIDFDARKLTSKEEKFNTETFLNGIVWFRADEFFRAVARDPTYKAAANLFIKHICPLEVTYVL